MISTDVSCPVSHSITTHRKEVTLEVALQSPALLDDLKDHTLVHYRTTQANLCKFVLELSLSVGHENSRNFKLGGFIISNGSLMRLLLA